MVARVALWIARQYQKAGREVNVSLVCASALLHDIGKIIEIRRGGEVSHPQKGAELINREGYPEVAAIIGAHGLNTIYEEPEKLNNLETKIVYYADKRVTHDRVVSLKERFGYLKKRYPKALGAIKKAGPLVQTLEKELFEPLGVDSSNIPPL